jgi:hypothetical protein
LVEIFWIDPLSPRYGAFSGWGWRRLRVWIEWAVADSRQRVVAQLCDWAGGTTPHHKNSLLRNITQVLGLGRILCEFFVSLWLGVSAIWVILHLLRIISSRRVSSCSLLTQGRYGYSCYNSRCPSCLAMHRTWDAEETEIRFWLWCLW